MADNTIMLAITHLGEVELPLTQLRKNVTACIDRLPFIAPFTAFECNSQIARGRSFTDFSQDVDSGLQRYDTNRVFLTPEERIVLFEIALDLLLKYRKIGFNEGDAANLRISATRKLVENINARAGFVDLALKAFITALGQETDSTLLVQLILAARVVLLGAKVPRELIDSAVKALEKVAKTNANLVVVTQARTALSDLANAGIADPKFVLPLSPSNRRRNQVIGATVVALGVIGLTTWALMR